MYKEHSSIRLNTVKQRGLCMSTRDYVNKMIPESPSSPQYHSGYNHGRPQGGGQEGALAPPGNSKIWGPPKDNLIRKIKNIYIN